MIKRILHSNGHFIWLILFFILHGYSGYIGLVSFTDLFILFVQYLLLAGIIFFLCNKSFRNRQHAAVYTSLFMLVFLFFEDIRIFIGGWKLIAPLSALRFYFPFSFLVLITGWLVFGKI
ncbi:MAG: hypothetical protein ACM3H8_11280, partial [Sphingobacteriales bacterium]